MKDNKILKATIIVPVHNEEASLGKFVKKFITDSERIKKHILELILVENGSTDNTPEVCKKLLFGNKILNGFFLKNAVNVLKIIKD